MLDARHDRAAQVDTGALYESTKANFIATVEALPGASLQLPVPATPAWAVRDVLAHVVGLAGDLNAQRFPEPGDAAGSAWTDAQVQRGAGRPIADLRAEWDREAPVFEEGLRIFGYEMGSHFVADLHAHYQDVRGAIGAPSEHNALTVCVALDHYTGFMGGLLSEAKWGTLDVITAGETAQLGGIGNHRARLRASPFEALRSLSGRRSARQIRALEWEGDVDAFLEWLESGFPGGYSLPVADLIE
jgi:hypothetical protein